MREFDLEKIIKQTINKADIGQKIALNFSGDPRIIDIKMSFKGGWEVTQTIIPGRMFEFTKGEDGYLLSIDISINPFNGIQRA